MTLDDIRRAAEILDRDRPQLIDFGGEKCYCMVIHPTFAEQIAAEDTPKRRWYWKEHMRRWEARYGRPFQLPEGKLVAYEGFKFVRTERI